MKKLIQLGEGCLLWDRNPSMSSNGESKIIEELYRGDIVFVIKVGKYGYSFCLTRFGFGFCVAKI